MKWGQIRALFFCSLWIGLFVYVYVKPEAKPSTISSKPTKKLLTKPKANLQNSFSKIHWNLNGMNQNDPILIQTIKKHILIPPNQPKQPLTLKNPKVSENGQFGQVPKIEKILGLYKNNPQSGFFIEAGAADGEWFSNTLYFERHHNWTGLLVEPNPDLLSDLVKTHR